MKAKAVQTINWQPFSLKHKLYIRNCLRNSVNVAEGAIRSGKTIDHCIVACAYLEECIDKIHLVSGSTIANAKMNVGDCNGYGLEHLFKGRCRWGKYKDNEALYIQTKTGEKIIIFAGGGKADSYKKILGNSYGMWLATEANEHYDSDDSRTSFIKVAMGRQAAAIQPIIMWDLNPSNPNSKIYRDYIDKWAKEGLVGGYNYQHFTMADNLSISEERKREIESRYDPSTIWYRRDILGERCVAEGLIYTTFADNNSKFFVSLNNIDKWKNDIWFINCGVDFGNSQSSHTFVATGICFNYSKAIILKSRRINESLTPSQLDEKFLDFVREVYSQYNKTCVYRCDSAETTLINGFKIAVFNARLENACIVKNALKTAINSRIELVSRMFAENRLFIVEEENQYMIDAFNQAVWDIKNPDERLDVIGHTNPVDMLDAFEYSIEEFSKNLMFATIRV